MPWRFGYPCARSRASREIRERIEQHVMIVDGGEIQVCISAGVAELSDKDSGAALITKADAALYVAKQGGRNRVEAASPQTQTQT